LGLLSQRRVIENSDVGRSGAYSWGVACGSGVRVECLYSLGPLIPLLARVVTLEGEVLFSLFWGLSAPSTSIGVGSGPGFIVVMLSVLGPGIYDLTWANVWMVFKLEGVLMDCWPLAKNL